MTSWDLAGKISVVVVQTLGLLVVKRLLGVLGLGPAPDARDVEIAVLRHQLSVLGRQVARPRYTPVDGGGEPGAPSSAATRASKRIPGVTTVTGRVGGRREVVRAGEMRCTLSGE